MRVTECLGLFTAFLSAVLVLPAAASSAGSRIEFSSLDASQPIHVSGTLYLPERASGPSPAVVLVHGTTGIDMRGAFYRGPLLSAGIAVFEVDFKTGIFTSALDRPKVDTFTPLAFAALKILRKQSTIDPQHIGIMGFSLGGAITLRTAVEDYRKQWLGDEKGFAVHVGFYPVCKGFIPLVDKIGGLTGASMIVLYGTEDSYGDGQAAPELKIQLKKKFNYELLTVEYPGAAHGFNRNAPPLAYPDPSAKGGIGHMAWDADAANDSVIKVMAFLHQNLLAK
ncbi:MAG: dienelactone hydrolase family protein [Terracidiphilus sp.]|jgi:dienelactone hydrolase